LNKAPSNSSEAHSNHSRLFERNKFVYPVISRRSGGISIGVNLNVDKACNFDCPYCQVDRTTIPEDSEIELSGILSELQQMLKNFDNRGVCTLDKFQHIPPEQKILRDIALSGDGEPTSFVKFSEVCQLLENLQKNSSLDFQLVLITNGSMLHKDSVTAGVGHLLRIKGAIWVKLDAGSEEYFQKVNVSKINYSRIVNNIQHIGRNYPITIQTLFFKMKDNGPSKQEIEKYIDVLAGLLAEGVVIDEIQMHSIARRPAQAACNALEKIELKLIAEQVTSKSGILVNVY